MINHLKKIMPANLRPDIECQQPSQGNSSCTTEHSILVCKPRLALLLGMCCNGIEPEESNTVNRNEHYSRSEQATPQPTVRGANQFSRLQSVGSPMHTRAILPASRDSPQPCPVDYDHAANLDLIHSIADTYELPSDSDTYSYISNCLMQKSYNSTTDSHNRKISRSHGSLHSTTLPIDQSINDSKITSTNEAASNFSKHIQNKRKRRSRSHSASRRSRYQCNAQSGSVMTDSNCSTVIL